MNQKTTNDFIIESKRKFGDKFDYTCVNYQGAKVRVKIKCNVHGLFFQTPQQHLAKKSYGCPRCALEILNKKNKNRDYSKRIKQPMSKEVFIHRVLKKYGSKFEVNLTNYTGVTGNPIKIHCPLHGIFEISPKYFLNKGNRYGCLKCSNENSALNRSISYKEAIERCHKLFNNKYHYPVSNELTYKNTTSKINIECDKHGIFILPMTRHLNGHECHQCKIELMKNVGGYSEEYFIQNSDLKNIKAYLYYLKINNGQYYKIGISRVSIANRIKCIRSKARRHQENLHIEILDYTEGNLYSLFLKEQKILEEFKEHRIYRRWSTELFKKNILPDIKDNFLSAAESVPKSNHKQAHHSQTL